MKEASVRYQEQLSIEIEARRAAENEIVELKTISSECLDQLQKIQEQTHQDSSISSQNHIEALTTRLEEQVDNIIRLVQL